MQISDVRAVITGGVSGLGLAVAQHLVARGGILAFRPLLLHASSPARQPRHRRVVHLEFAAVELAGGLEWHERVT